MSGSTRDVVSVKFLHFFLILGETSGGIKKMSAVFSEAVCGEECCVMMQRMAVKAAI